jgi:hypothetical protein
MAARPLPGDDPSPARPQRRDRYPRLSPETLFARFPDRKITPETDADGEPLDAPGSDPDTWDDWTDNWHWVAAEDLDETDPALPLFVRHAGGGGGVN